MKSQPLPTSHSRHSLHGVEGVRPGSFTDNNQFHFHGTNENNDASATNEAPVAEGPAAEGPSADAPDATEQYPVISSTSDLEIGTTKARWYVVSVFSLFCLLQCWSWNANGPVVNALHYAYDWKGKEVALMAMLGVAAVPVTLPFLPAIKRAMGAKKTLLAAIGCVALSNFLRSSTVDDNKFYWVRFSYSIFTLS